VFADIVFRKSVQRTEKKKKKNYEIILSRVLETKTGIKHDLDIFSNIYIQNMCSNNPLHYHLRRRNKKALKI
jgi:uncharacterized protein YozE (UPF0346 family)